MTWLALKQIKSNDFFANNGLNSQLYTLGSRTCETAERGFANYD